ncbi:hypothetical protein ACLKA6_003910 [Drosophila palustris]
MSFNEKLAAFAVVRESISQRRQELTDRLTRNNNLVSRLTVALETELYVEDDDVDLLEVSNLGIPRSVWMRKRFGVFWERDIPANDERFFKESFRMERPTFALLVSRLGILKKKDTNFRNAIPLEKRIAIALYTLGSSAEYRAIGSMFGVSSNSVCNILHEFCRALVLEFTDEYLTPNFLTDSYVDECVQGFEAIGFPQCLGAIDGCHIEIDPPAAEAVDHHNYKGWSSVVLFAMVDYRYRFQYVDIGAPGRCNDSYIFQSSSLSKMLNLCPLLESKSRKICGVDVPVLLIGDSAFRFSRNLMKPYPYSTDQTIKRKTFNYNLSKSRRVVENAFGHVKARFRRVGMGLHSHPKKNAVIIMACCVLHNILNVHNSAIDEAWKAALGEHDKEQPHQSNTSTDYSRPAEEIRSAIADYLCII